jgi:hypothetical protein
VRYHLRFQIIPGPHVARDARILAAFCRQHAVEEVVLFVAAEEWNPGLLTRAQEDQWFDAIAKAKRILEAAGLSISLNIWATVLHFAGGKKLPGDRGLKPMVSATGQVNPGVASFADPAWVRYITEQYGRFARLGFRVLWIEDDFRYHNHRPLVWGGGFEPGMIRRFEQKLGRRASRELLVRNILRPGDPHPWRGLWLATWREAQLEAARAIAAAVAENSPCPATLGLMSTGPIEHSPEGRDWGQLLDAMTLDGRVAHRPHFRGYRVTPGREIARNIMMFDVQRSFQPARAELAPEIENYPFTRWSHSDTRTFAEMVMSLQFGCDALLLDIFPFAGNPANREEAIGDMLDGCRPALHWVAQRFDRHLETVGVSLPYRFDSAQHVHTPHGKSMLELHVSPFQAGELLLRMGVPITYADAPVRAMFGPIAWAFDDDEIRRLLSGGLLLDAASAEILCRRGYGRLLGVDVVEILDREQSDYAVEEFLAGGLGVPVGHFFNVNLTTHMALLKPQRGAKAWSRILNAERRTIGAGMVAFRNSLGGRVVTYAVADPSDRVPYNDQRQAQWQAAVRFAAGGRFAAPMVTSGAHLMPIYFADERRRLLAIYNESDDASRPVIHLPAAPAGPVEATLLAPLKAPRPIRLSLRPSGRAAVAQSAAELPHLGCLVLAWQATS